MINRSDSWLRWVVLVFACIALFGNYYCYDNPTALEEEIEDKLGLSSLKYAMLYSIYSIPNTILPLIGGVFIDRVGVNICLIIFTIALLAGQLLCAYGIAKGSYELTLAGRLLFGLGGETQGVAVSALLAVWFKDKEMAFAMAANLSLARLGSVVNDQLSPFFHEEVSLSFAFLAGAFLVGVCLIMTIFLFLIEQNFKSRARRRGASIEKITSGEDFHIEYLWNFDGTFWLLVLSCVVVYGTILPFNNIAGSLFQDKFGYSKTKANTFLMIPFSISAIASPFLGGIVDRVGQRAWLILFAPMFLMLSHAMLGFTSIEPLIWVIVLGSAFAIYASSLAPGIARVVEEDQVGTAYGIVMSMQNIGLFLFPLIAGEIKDGTGGYKWVEIFFAGLAGLGTVISVFLLISDGQSGGRLNQPSMQKDKLENETGVQSYRRMSEDPNSILKV